MNSPTIKGSNMALDISSHITTNEDVILACYYNNLLKLLESIIDPQGELIRQIRFAAFENTREYRL